MTARVNDQRRNLGTSYNFRVHQALGNLPHASKILNVSRTGAGGGRGRGSLGSPPKTPVRRSLPPSSSTRRPIANPLAESLPREGDLGQLSKADTTQVIALRRD